MITLCFLAIVCARVYVSFGEPILFENFTAILKTIVKTGILYFGALLPVAWIAVLQRKIFYPSLLAVLVMTGIGITGLLTHGLLGSVIPWFAVVLLSVPNGDVINGVAYTSIGLCAAVGFGLAAYSFKKQEL